MSRRFCLMLTLGMLLLSACDVSPGKHGASSASSSNGLLYVATANSILQFSNALSATGNVTPAATISGTATQLSSPQHLLLDVTTNRLFVANQGGASILLFQTASTRIGNTPPDAVITSSSMTAPIDLALDTGFNNFLYVADGGNILVFAGQSSLSGTVNTLPVHTINTSLTIGAILLDTVNNRLLIADTAGDGINILDNASTQTGTAVFTGRIAGPDTQLSRPNGLAFDNAGRLIVSNGGTGGITVYVSSAIPLGGDIVPVASITGALTKLASPGQILVNASAGSSGELYVADALAASVLTYLNIGTISLNDNLAPSREFTGPGTGLNTTITGMALDATR
jgi:sugar lactone lactonase YvrE